MTFENTAVYWVLDHRAFVCVCVCCLYHCAFCLLCLLLSALCVVIFPCVWGNGFLQLFASCERHILRHVCNTHMHTHTQRRHQHNLPSLLVPLSPSSVEETSLPVSPPPRLLSFRSLSLSLHLSFFLPFRLIHFKGVITNLM